VSLDKQGKARPVVKKEANKFKRNLIGTAWIRYTGQ